jgi:hypothetical protein
MWNELVYALPKVVGFSTYSSGMTPTSNGLTFLPYLCTVIRNELCASYFSAPSSDDNQSHLLLLIHHFTILSLMLFLPQFISSHFALYFSVNGKYSSWSVWSPCSSTCGLGQKKRSRTCDNPRAAYGGLDCNRYGPNEQAVDCFVADCPGKVELIQILLCLNCFSMNTSCRSS